ncbi:MAG: Holliday junction resolvase-like protein [Thermoplasmata archaeon]
MISDFSTFIREGRHIFSVCPECGSVHRLSDLELSRRGKYVPDWMDKVERSRDALEQRRGTLEGRAAELQRVAKERAERKVLPQLLWRSAPMFYKLKIDPRDVRTIIHPLDFVVFQGMNSRDGVQGVSLVSLDSANPITSSIGKTILARDFGWRTVRVGDDGVIESDERSQK